MSISKGYKLVPVEPTEEIIRSMLAVRWPATYRNALRFSGSGPATAAQTERDIAEVKEQFGAMLAAAPTPPQPVYDEAKERELFEAFYVERANTLPLALGSAIRYAGGQYVNDFALFGWMVWLECAQSRAKTVEVGDE